MMYCSEFAMLTQHFVPEQFDKTESIIKTDRRLGKGNMHYDS